MATPQLLNAPILLLKEGTDTSQGKPQIISNINACQGVVDMVRSTLGPRGMDKLLVTDRNQVTITNDGATVMNLLNVVHPAAKVLVNIAQSQDDEVGDGTTSVVLFAGELLQEAKTFIEEGVAPQIIFRGYQMAAQMAVAAIKKIEVSLKDNTDTERRQLLERCAKTSLNSKLVSANKDQFAKMVVDAVLHLDASLDKSLVGIKKVLGGSAAESMLVEGVAFKKTFSYAGFQQQPKRFEHPKILLLNVELELKAEKENAEVRIENPDDYQAIVSAEWTIIYEKLQNIVDSGAQVVFSRLPIGDLATQYFADRNVFCAGRVDEADMKRTARATGAQIQTSMTRISPDVLGSCGVFEEMQIGSERYNFLKQCPMATSVTLILRGGAQQFVDEAERSLNDAIMIVRRAVKTNAVVGGGGAVEMEVSRLLRDQARCFTGKQQLIVNAFARALEVIPRTLAVNCGVSPTDTLNKLRQAHFQAMHPGSEFMGLNYLDGGICNTFEAFIWEPSLVKTHVIETATEAACVILSIDETVRNPSSNAGFGSNMPAMAAGKHRPGRRGVRRM